MLEDLLAAIKELTETLKAMSAAAPTTEQEEEAPEPAPTKRTRGKKAAAPAEDETTLEDVRAALKVLVDEGSNDTVRALLKKFGGSKLSDVAESKYADLKKAAEEAAGGSEGEDDLL